MTQQGKGKFCGACRKTVIDFTSMSDRDLVQFFRNHTGNVCGRLQPGQLHRDILVPRKRIPWVRYFFQFTLPAFLFSMKAAAQGMVRVSYEKTECRVTKGELKIPVVEPAAENWVHGKVMDQDGVAVPYATLQIKGSHSGTVTDSSGRFRIKTDVVNPVIVASMVGFEVQEKMADSSFLEFRMKPANTEMGVVVIVGMIQPRRTRKIPLIQKRVEKSFTLFSVFPNPVHALSAFSIHPLNMAAGVYQLSIVNAAGKSFRRMKLKSNAEMR
jgi:hypothetical protein